MSEAALNVMAVVGSLNKNAVTRCVILHVAEQFKASGVTVDVLDLLGEPLALFNPDSAHEAEGFEHLKKGSRFAFIQLLR